MAATVEGVLGTLSADALGVTLVHEHFRTRSEIVSFQWPHLYDPEHEKEAAAEAARAAMAHGVKTVCDPTAAFFGRDVNLLRHVASETGIQVIACTGVNSEDLLPWYFRNRPMKALADCFVHDITVGIQETDAKAAFIKVDADEPGFTDDVVKVHEAAGRASAETGAPIMAHTRPSTETGIRQIEIFESQGADLERVQLAHTGDGDDLDYIERLIDKGVYIGMDRYGLERPLKIEERNDVVAELLRRGYADRIHLSQDYCATIDWLPDIQKRFQIAQGTLKGWSTTLLFEEVIPALKEQGMTDEQLDTILVHNPRRWLAGA